MLCYSNGTDKNPVWRGSTLNGMGSDQWPCWNGLENLQPAAVQRLVELSLSRRRLDGQCTTSYNCVWIVKWWLCLVSMFSAVFIQLTLTVSSALLLLLGAIQYWTLSCCLPNSPSFLFASDPHSVAWGIMFSFCCVSVCASVQSRTLLAWYLENY